MFCVYSCAVCEAPSRLVALHSQSNDIPNCPESWDLLWTGYSFLMHTDTSIQGSGQALSSPGSCLEKFRASPVIECHGHGRCNKYATANSYWLAGIKEHEMFEKPIPEAKSADFTDKVSRCAVCMRRRYSRSFAPGTFGESYPSVNEVVPEDPYRTRTEQDR